MADHFDDDFLAVMIQTSDKEIGKIHFGHSNQGPTPFNITRIEFRKRAAGSSPLIGFKFEGPPNLEGVVKGLRAVYGRTIVNGAVDNPIFAARRPYLVADNGVDLEFPADLEGAFSRNLGGRAADFGTFQGHAQARDPRNGSPTQVNNGGGSIPRGNPDTSAGETRPDNYADQWYFVMDDYVDPTASGTPSGQTISINTAYPTGRTIGGKAEFECIYEYGLSNHTALTAINVAAPSGFTSMGVILSVDGGADNGTIFQGIEDASNDISSDDLLFNRSTGSFTHTYEGNWSGYTMRLIVRYLEA